MVGSEKMSTGAKEWWRQRQSNGSKEVSTRGVVCREGAIEMDLGSEDRIEQEQARSRQGAEGVVAMSQLQVD